MGCLAEKGQSLMTYLAVRKATDPHRPSAIAVMDDGCSKLSSDHLFNSAQSTCEDAASLMCSGQLDHSSRPRSWERSSVGEIG